MILTVEQKNGNKQTITWERDDFVKTPYICYNRLAKGTLPNGFKQDPYNENQIFISHFEYM